MSKSCSSVYIANFVKGCLSRSNVQWFSSICVWCQAAQSCNYAVSLRCLPLRLIIDKGYVTDFPKAPTIALDSTLTSICSAYALTLRQRLIDDGHFILS